jgi:hypothetical protein
VIAAWLSKKRTDLRVTSPNQYALLESELSTSAFGCTVPTPVNKPIFPTKPNYARLAPWAKEHAQLHECFCKRENCYWHHPGDQFNEKEYEDQEVKPWVNKDSSPELPDAGSESRKGASTSEQGSIRSLNCETAQGLERGDRPTSKPKNQTHRPQGREGEQTPNLEMRHSFQRRYKGERVPPGTAKWIAQRIAEEKPEQRIGMLRIWVNPKRQVEATEETIEEINALSDEDAEAALNEMR